MRDLRVPSRLTLREKVSGMARLTSVILRPSPKVSRSSMTLCISLSSEESHASRLSGGSASRSLSVLGTDGSTLAPLAVKPSMATAFWYTMR